MARQLDIDPEILTELTSYIEVELTNHRAERAELEDRWIAEQKDFWAEPSNESSSVPHTSFASIIVPITAIAIEAIHARDMGQLFGLKELVSVHVADKHQNIRSDIEKLFNHELLNTMKFREKIEPILLQTTKHGTGIGITEYRESKTHVVQLRQDGNSPAKEVKVPVYREKGTVIDGIPVADFLMPFYVTRIEDAPWVGHAFRASEYTVKQMVASGYIAPNAYELLTGYYDTAAASHNRFLEDINQLSHTRTV